MKNICKIFVVVFICFYSCNDAETITSEQKYMADTLYAKQLDVLRLQGDSLCKIYKDTFYQKAVDSLQDEYLDNFEYYFRK
ncbi:MAG: hypothetical protein IPL63_07445 [Saprospiraceae bacterium]|nr:hypothetical protein [Saprospiraceae bacterium]MBK6564423.1 hypothetical protein [Saprospiraceae bacterium]MBK7523894.1 hypothetical protein [Saprospiraceae bacterium]MBK8079140.1 hypothetical protein [Saprospiraceae bacterium]MBK8371943.1 hypothetical protein [Saprospiraceae bacterium]